MGSEMCIRDRLQRLDEGDHLSEVVLVPHEQTEETDQLNSEKEN